MNNKTNDVNSKKETFKELQTRFIQDKVVRDYWELLCDIYSLSVPEEIVVNTRDNITKYVYPQSIQRLIDRVRRDLDSYVANNYSQLLVFDNEVEDLR
jgi:hypothetical protein